MPYDTVKYMNEITNMWKREFVFTAAWRFPDANIPTDLATQNWTGILQTSYRKILDAYSPELSYRAIVPHIMQHMPTHLPTFASDPIIAKFYDLHFGPAKQVADKMIRQGFGYRPNATIPQHPDILVNQITQNAAEITAITSNPATYGVEPVLYWKNACGFVMNTKSR